VAPWGKARLSVRRENSAFSEVLPVSALAYYVTEQANPGRPKKIALQGIQTPIIQTLVDELDEGFLLARLDVVEFVLGLGLFQEGVIFFWVAGLESSNTINFTT